MGYNYDEERVNIQTLRESIEKLIYDIEMAKTEILYAPAKDAIKQFYIESSCEMFNFYEALKNCEENILLDMAFMGGCDG